MSSMTPEEMEIVAEIRDALIAIKQRLHELADSVRDVANAIERAAEEIRDAGR